MNIALMCLVVTMAQAEDMAKRHAFLSELREVLPRSEPWEAWLEKSGELPPDFDAMPSCATLPDPLGDVSSPDQWPARRQALIAEFKHWILGTVPPPPDNMKATVAESEEQGARVLEIELRFGAAHRAYLHLALMLPKGEGPYPVFLTQDNHRGWALIALKRGYAACVYAGADSQDDTDSFVAAYPEYDWSRLTRRAWAASRCVDFLTTLPEVRADQIVLTGHSRNGKLSLIASALDERIAAVISSSSGAGGSMPARLVSEQHFAEGPENITRQFPEWFHPRFRFFAGREHKLPVDFHELVALSAPRPCLLSIAVNDGVESTWAMQRTYLSVKPVYRLLGAEANLGVLWREGGHETWPTMIERYLDWTDARFGRGKGTWPERYLHAWDWEAWRHAQTLPDVASYPERPFGGLPLTGDELRDAVTAMLGDAPPSAHASIGTYGEEPDHIERLLDRLEAGKDLEKHDLMFGEYLNADVYAPAGTKESGRKLPGILWLHPQSFPRGYGAAYRRGEQAFRTFARAGYVVFAYDQLGCGRRVEEEEGFYERHPQWSIMGNMVRDAQAALDVMSELPYVDTTRMWVVGYGTGALIGAHLMVLDERPTGAVFIAPPPPFRLDKDVEETGGVARWSKDYMLLPKLGLFVGNEDRVPYDMDDLLAAVAPRPLLVVSPRLNREAPCAAMQRAMDAVTAAYARAGVSERVVHDVPNAYNHLDETAQRRILEQLAVLAERASTEEPK